MRISTNSPTKPKDPVAYLLQGSEVKWLLIRHEDGENWHSLNERGGGAVFYEGGIDSITPFDTILQTFYEGDTVTLTF